MVQADQPRPQVLGLAMYVFVLGTFWRVKEYKANPTMASAIFYLHVGFQVQRLFLFLQSSLGQLSSRVLALHEIC